MTVENLIPSLKYIGIGGLILLGVVLLLWLGLVAFVLFGTKGIPKAITNLFMEIGDGELKDVYALTSPSYRERHSLKELGQFIQIHKLKTYKRITLSTPTKLSADNAYSMEIVAILRSGKEIPMEIDLVRSQKQWLIDRLVVQPKAKSDRSNKYD